LLIHGLAGGAHEWRATAKHLVSSHRVLAFDQRGHGLSDKPSGNYSRDTYVRDAIKVVEQLALGPVVLIGQSMGGVNAMLVAARRQDLARALIMIEATPARNPTAAHDIKAWLHTWPARFPTREEALAFFGGSSQRSRAWVEGLEVLEDGSGLCPRFRPDDMVDSISDLAERDYWGDWSRTDCPTLVIVGDSGSVPSDALDEMRRRKPSLRLVRVNNAGHDVHLDQPGSVAKTVQICARRWVRI